MENLSASLNDTKVIDNPFSEGIRPDADVVVNVEDYYLHMHSLILGECSPVFKAMLSENFSEGSSKRIELKEKKFEDVVQMFKFFYPRLGATIEGIPNHERMLDLCREYDLNWLKDHIEKYLLSFSEINDKTAVYYIYLGEEFQLTRLKDKLLKHSFQDCFACIKGFEHFNKLKKNSKAIILKTLLQKRLEYNNCISGHNYRETMIDFIMSFISDE